MPFALSFVALFVTWESVGVTLYRPRLSARASYVLQLTSILESPSIWRLESLKSGNRVVIQNTIGAY